MKSFLKKGEVSLINGGYLSNKEGRPVYNQDFVDEQKHAEVVVKMAAAIKGKNFDDTPGDCLKTIQREVLDSINSSSVKTFIAVPTEPKQPTQAKLAKEALAFMDFVDSKADVERVNTFLNDNFSTLSDFNDHGLFFCEDVVKLNNLYTIEEVIAAVKEVIDIV